MTRRDMTDKQFLAALKRNNFSKPVLFWCGDLENEGHSYGIIVDKSGHLYKRQTLAHLLRCRAETEKRAKVTP